MCSSRSAAARRSHAAAHSGWLTAGAARQDIMIGDECTQARDMLETSYPITNGIVQNWEDMTHLL